MRGKGRGGRGGSFLLLTYSSVRGGVETLLPQGRERITLPWLRALLSTYGDNKKCFCPRQAMPTDGRNVQKERLLLLMFWRHFCGIFSPITS